VRVYYQWLEYDPPGRYGGWTKQAKHKPFAHVIHGLGFAEKVQKSGKIWLIRTLRGAEIRKRMLNLWDIDTRERVPLEGEYPKLVKRAPGWLSDTFLREMAWAQAVEKTQASRIARSKVGQLKGQQHEKDTVHNG